MDFEDPLIKRRATLNPYFKSAGMLLNRLLWDLQPQSWISRSKLVNQKNAYKGKKAIIFCNGPSLNKVDFDYVMKSGCFIFGLNKINLLFDRTSLRPDCIVATNPLVIRQNSNFYNQTKIPLYIDFFGFRHGFIKPRNNVIFFHSGISEGFARDCSISINQGYTVTYVALQLAFHLGFQKVALVGADHSFSTSGPANKTVKSKVPDESHFDPRYFSNVEWQLPDLFESEVAYNRANKIYEAHGREIINCTVGGKLEVFKRRTLEDFI
tara:strand:- start:137 stop:937 length:801 start_codon:yes stop_codon:yes gene_type:complete